MESGDQTASETAMAEDFRGRASPPSLADAAKSWPWALTASFLPSGETASERKAVSVVRVTAGEAETPRSSMGILAALPEAMSSDQMLKSRSKTMVLPEAPMDGQRTRPSLK